MSKTTVHPPSASRKRTRQVVPTDIVGFANFIVAQHQAYLQQIPTDQRMRDRQSQGRQLCNLLRDNPEQLLGGGAK